MKRTLCLVLIALAPALAGDEARIAYGEARVIATLANEQIDESSGLVAGGPANPGIFWTHNDSGDAPRIFAFDMQGRHRGVYTLDGIQVLDCEDLAAYSDADGQRWLILCDTGDNARRRGHVLLHVVREPQVGDEPAEALIEVERTLTLRYPDGAHDVESVAVAPREGRIYLVVKDRGEGTQVFTIPLHPETDEVEAEGPMAKLGLPMTTAMDMSPDERRITILTYTHAHEWQRGREETWVQTFRRASRQIPLPPLHQREALCYGADGFTIYVTSEKLPTPLVEIRRLQDEDEDPPAPAPEATPESGSRDYY